MKKNKNTITKKQGQALVTIARHAIMERIARGPALDDATLKLLEDKRLQKTQGTFVTLMQNGELRGCIGTLTPTESIVEGVKRNALSAALNDHRFSPVKPAEMDSISIEVSVLTELSPLEYSDSADLISKLTPGTDGLMVRHGAARATFLPQVWEKLPEPEEFLSQLCVKAGLPEDTWLTTKFEVLTYQTQYFDEKK